MAERRDKIVKRLSIERQIPASSQKKEITREITEIKRKSLIEDKKAIHESEIFMQLPADNSVKSSVIPDQVIKIKMGKMDSTEVSKSEFDKELTHKFKSSSRSSEEEPEENDTTTARPQVGHEEMENIKIVKDITSVEKPSKIIDSLINEKPSISSGSKQLTEDFLVFEKLTQLPSQIPVSIPSTTKTEQFIDMVEVKPSDEIDFRINETAKGVVEDTVEAASKKVESIISSFQFSNQETQPKETLKEIVHDFLGSEKNNLFLSKDESSKLEISIIEKSNDETNDCTTASVKDKIKAFTETQKCTKAKAEDPLKNVESCRETTSPKTFAKITSENVFVTDVTKTVAETIQTFNADTTRGTVNAKSDIEIIKDSKVQDAKAFLDKKSDESEQQLLDIKKAIVSETKSIAETIKIFTEPKTKNVEKETTKIETGSQFVTDSLNQGDKLSSDVKITEIEDIELKTEAIKEHITERKDSALAELDDTFSKGKTKPITEDLENDSNNLRITSSEYKIITNPQTNTVAQTIKTFSEPKVTTAKIEEKQSDAIQMREESKKLSDTIKSLSESFEKPKPEKEKIIPSTNIENKIADFEAKKVTYEYHGLEPKPRLSLATKQTAEENEIITKEIVSTDNALLGTQSVAETGDSTFKESLVKLEEMKSIVSDARKITQDFLHMEQQTQLPITTNIPIKEEIKSVEKIVKTTITFPSVTETSSMTDEIVKKQEKQELNTSLSDDIQKDTILQSVQDTLQDSKKLTLEFLAMEQKSQLLHEKQTADDISELSTETSQHSLEKSPIVEHDSEKTFQQFEKSEIDTKKITHDFLSMEQKHQPCPLKRQKEEKDESKRTSIIDELLIQASDVIASISAATEVSKEPLNKTPGEKSEKGTSDLSLKSDKFKGDGIDILAAVKHTKDITTSAVKTLSKDFLSFEQSPPMDITSKQSSQQIELVPTEQRKSLTDVDFCKSVKDSITKKMSEGLIDISDELKMQGINKKTSFTLIYFCYCFNYCKEVL